VKELGDRRRKEGGRKRRKGKRKRKRGERDGGGKRGRGEEQNVDLEAEKHGFPALGERFRNLLSLVNFFEPCGIF
jgi:hypothetical protein